MSDMPDTITFIFPGLLNKQCQKFLNDTDIPAMDQLSTLFKKLLAKSKKTPITSLQQWFLQSFGLPIDYSNSAAMMAKAQGLAGFEDNSNYWLRADPVMLTVGNNGLFCRGNSVLNLTEKERSFIQLLVNNHFREQSIELILCDNKRGFIKFTEKSDCSFTTLTDVMGNEISNLLPTGNKAAFWHGVLTDIQMLLHNCDINQKRQNNGQPVISCLWLWAESDVVETVHRENNTDWLYTDDLALSGVLGKSVTLCQLGAHFESLSRSKKQYEENNIIIYVAEFLEACSQNDPQRWLALYQQWVLDWLLPALQSVNNGKLKQVKLLVDDGYCYQYNHFSQWCFWR